MLRRIIRIQYITILSYKTIRPCTCKRIIVKPATPTSDAVVIKKEDYRDPLLVAAAGDDILDSHY